MQRKFVLIVIFLSIILAAGLIAVGWVIYKRQLISKPSETTTASPVSGGDIFEKAKNPVKGSIPETNPFKPNTNPFAESKTNPFKGVYKNPF